MTDTTELPPRDHNRPPEPIPTADGVTARLVDEFTPLQLDVAALLNAARPMKEVTDDETKAAVTEHVKTVLRKLADVEETRKVRKEPFFRSAQAVDTYFNAIKDRLQTTADILTKRVGIYNARILAEEQSRRAAEAAAEARALPPPMKAPHPPRQGALRWPLLPSRRPTAQQWSRSRKRARRAAGSQSARRAAARASAQRRTETRCCRAGR